MGPNAGGKQLQHEPATIDQVGSEGPAKPDLAAQIKQDSCHRLLHEASTVN